MFRVTLAEGPERVTDLMSVSRIRKLHLVSRDLMTPPKLPGNAPIAVKQTEVTLLTSHTLKQEFIHHQRGVISSMSRQKRRHTKPLFLLTPPLGYILLSQVKGRGTVYLMLDNQFFHVLV